MSKQTDRIVRNHSVTLQFLANTAHVPSASRRTRVASGSVRYLSIKITKCQTPRIAYICIKIENGRSLLAGAARPDNLPWPPPYIHSAACAPPPPGLFTLQIAACGPSANRFSTRAFSQLSVVQTPKNPDARNFARMRYKNELHILLVDMIILSQKLGNRCYVLERGTRNPQD